MATFLMSQWCQVAKKIQNVMNEDVSAGHLKTL